MEAGERHQLIAERVRAQGSASVADLAAALATSEVTVRRDLSELEKVGVLRRTHGGAENVLLRSDELPYAFRAMRSSVSKERIAVAAAKLIRDGEVVVVDSGTTGLAAARALIGRPLTVLPLSVQQIAVFESSARTRLLLPGGEVRPGEGSVIGPIAERTLSAYRFDTFLLTVCGVTAEAGVTAYDVQDAAVKRAAARQSARVIAIADGSKLTVTAMAHVLDVAEIATLITDATAPVQAVELLQQAGVDVVQV